MTEPGTIRVAAPSRLHFGLLSFPGGESWPNRDGAAVVSARRFGGAGLMIQAPGVAVAVTGAECWSAEGPLAERALHYARRMAAALPDLRPHRVHVEYAAPEHAGYGTGTQLGLAVAKALAVASGRADLNAAKLARLVGRGERSGLGVHGFAHGGFLVDGGKVTADGVAPLVARVAFPEAWRVLLVEVPGAAGLHGSREQESFAHIKATAATDTLCRLVLLGLLPALVERDERAFGEALYDFNARAGEGFAPMQGGVHAAGLTAELVAFLRRQGARGVGQSSWGPTVFAVTADGDTAQGWIRCIQKGYGGQVMCRMTTGCNEGASGTQASPIA